ncbi:hypothetical protein LguiA_023366 [Lonicera macranthoides]
MKMNSNTLKVIVLLFVMNSISISIYLSFHHDYFRPKSPPENYISLPEQHKNFPSITSNSKPWPILPSYLPWSPNPKLPLGSCEAYFGNGFTRRIDFLKSSQETLRESAGTGWFRCLYSGTLRSSICEGGRIRMHPERIKMAIGGERLEAVMGRGEEEEFPVFEFGAFDIEVGEGFSGGRKLASGDLLDRCVPRNGIERHTMRSLIDSIRKVGTSEFECSEWVDEPALLITRFEYANLFHTVTDWYSAYVASRVTGLPNRPHLIFVDGHCTASLEETWKAMFSSLRYAKHFEGPVCFRHAILTPLGYETALFKGLSERIDCRGAPAHELWEKPNNQKTARLAEFGEMIKASFDLPLNRVKKSKVVSGQNVLFIRREDYLAHPRHSGKPESRLSNEQEVFESLKSWASKHAECKVNLVNGLFAHMPLKEQVRAIEDAAVIIGAHGAGLTHIVSATPDTVILEIVSSAYRRPHFQLIAQWKGLEYHAIYLQGSHAKPEVVIDNLSGILRSLGC